MVGCVRAVLDVVVDEDDPEQREQGVHAEEAEQRKEAVANADMGGCARRGSDEAKDEPGLTADFSSHPAGSGGDVRQGPTQQEAPENPARGVELASPEVERSDGHERAEPSSEADHDVVAVKQQRQGGRPLVAGKVIEALDFSGGGAVDEEAEDLVDTKRIVVMYRYKIDELRPVQGPSCPSSLREQVEQHEQLEQVDLSPAK